MINIKLIKATKQHSKLLWNWRNDPITRKMSRNTQKISWKEHSLWLEKKLTDQSSKIFIGMNNDNPIGVLRFDRCEINKTTYEISINISPLNRGKGIGKKLLIKGIEQFLKEVIDCKIIKAEVKNFNIPSNNLFRSCGFILCIRENINQGELNLYEYLI